MSDQKTYPCNRDTVNAWAKGKRERGISKAGNIIFDGDKIYSYGSHYLMAHRIREEDVPGTFRSRFGGTFRSGGLLDSLPTEVILLNEDGYSHTTQCHRSLVRTAARSVGALLIEVPYPSTHPGKRRMATETQAKKNLDGLMEQATERAGDFVRARKRDKSRMLVRAVKRVYLYTCLFRKDLQSYLRSHPPMAEAVDLLSRAKPESSQQRWCVAIGIASLLSGESFEEVKEDAVYRRLMRRWRADSKKEIQVEFDHAEITEALDSIEKSTGVGHIENILSVDYEGIIEKWREGEISCSDADRSAISRERIDIRKSPVSKETKGGTEANNEVLFPPAPGGRIYATDEQVMRALILSEECRTAGKTFEAPGANTFVEEKLNLNGTTTLTSTGKYLLRDQHYGFGSFGDPRCYWIREDGTLVFGKYTLHYEDLMRYAEDKGWAIGDMLMIDEQDVEIVRCNRDKPKDMKSEAPVENGEEGDDLFAVV